MSISASPSERFGSFPESALRSAILSFLEDRSLRSPSSHTLRGYAIDLEQFLQFFHYNELYLTVVVKTLQFLTLKYFFQVLLDPIHL